MGGEYVPDYNAPSNPLLNIPSPIQKTLDINPLNILLSGVVRSQTRTSGVGSLTIYTTPTDQEFFLNHVLLTGQSSVGGGEIAVYGYIQGTKTKLLGLPEAVIPDLVNIPIDPPVKIDPNTAITLENTGAQAGYGLIFGYTITPEQTQVLQRIQSEILRSF